MTSRRLLSFSSNSLLCASASKFAGAEVAPDVTFLAGAGSESLCPVLPLLNDDKLLAMFAPSAPSEARLVQ